MSDSITGLIIEFMKMNDNLSHKLDTIIQRMDALIAIESQNKIDFYGDGR
jgi:hypothetical protein